jgi:hypothetical protein
MVTNRSPFIHTSVVKIWRLQLLKRQNMLTCVLKLQKGTSSISVFFIAKHVKNEARAIQKYTLY